MKHPVSRELYAYWDQLRAQRAAPERADLDPAAIRTILADTFVLEVVAGMGDLDRDFPVRLSGTRLNAFFLDELKGSSLLSIWQAEYRSAVEEMLACVLDERAPVVAGAKAGPRDNLPVDLELLLLPLRHHGKTHTRVLGSLAPSRVPSWLGLLPVEPLTLTSFRRIDSGSKPASVRLAPQIADLSQRPTRYGPLRVYQGGR